MTDMRLVPDLMLMSKLVGSETYKTVLRAKERGITAERLVPEAKEIFEFVEDHYKKYGTMPSYQTVAIATEYELSYVEHDLEFLIDEVLNRNLFDFMVPEAQVIAEHLERREPKKAYEAMATLVSRIRHENVVPSPVTNMLSYGDQVMQDYQDAKEGKFGIMTPWETLNQTLMGFQPEDLVTIVARGGKGKTWALINLVEHAHKTGHRPLLITTEMAEKAMARRYYSLHLKIPYGYLRRGSLNSHYEERLAKGIADIKASGQEIPIVGGTHNVDINTIGAAIDKVEPDIVFIDGLYLVRGTGEGRFEKVANVADEMKAMCKQWKVPIVVTTQFNRSVDANATKADIASIAMSDNIGWVSDIVMCLLQSKNMRDEGKMNISTLKFREGDLGPDVTIEWNFRDMEFGEISAVEEREM